MSGSTTRPEMEEAMEGSLAERLYYMLVEVNNTCFDAIPPQLRERINLVCLVYEKESERHG